MIGIGGARASLTGEGRSGTHGSRGATSVLADGGRHPHTHAAPHSPGGGNPQFGDGPGVLAK